MKVATIAVRRSQLGLPSSVVVRAGVALGHALVVLTGVGLGLWLLISLFALRPTVVSG